jgi:hypothetical protein
LYLNSWFIWMVLWAVGIPLRRAAYLMTYWTGVWHWCSMKCLDIFSIAYLLAPCIYLVTPESWSDHSTGWLNDYHVFYLFCRLETSNFCWDFPVSICVGLTEGLLVPSIVLKLTGVQQRDARRVIAKFQNDNVLYDEEQLYIWAWTVGQHRFVWVHLPSSFFSLPESWALLIHVTLVQA